MPLICLTTEIEAPIQRCFDLARSIDFHIQSAGNTQECAVAGTVTGLIEMGESVTWQAKHFGIRQQLTVKITGFESPVFFQDVQVKGVFKLLDHRHYFESNGSKTIMRDEFHFTSPFGILGRIVDTLFLESYFRDFLTTRNHRLKQALESSEWKTYLAKEASNND